MSHKPFSVCCQTDECVALICVCCLFAGVCFSHRALSSQGHSNYGRWRKGNICRERLGLEKAGEKLNQFLLILRVSVIV